MKLLILNEGVEPHAEYENRYIKNGALDLQGISDNECIEIVLKDIVNNIPVNEIVPMLVALSGKLRKGGKMYINGLDLRTFSRRLLKREISDEEFNKIVYSLKSVTSVPTIKTIISQSNLQIEKLAIRGMQYELIATR